MHYRDVVIQTNECVLGKESVPIDLRPAKERVELSSGIWLGRIELDIAEAVMETCETKTLGITPPAAQFAQLYSFVRELPANSHIYRWDEDNQLTATLAMSRIVHPTSTGLRYAARIAVDTGGAKRVYPAQAQVRGVTIDAFLSPKRNRDWLTAEDVKILSTLPPPTATFSPRIHRALWHHEFAARTYYLDHRWALVCTGLEALVHTDKIRNTAQFVKRVSCLGHDVGVVLTEADAELAYDLRSRIVHGVSFLSTETSQAPSDEQLDLYTRLEDTLRMAIFFAIQREEFGDIFRDDNRIRDRWPI